jgi:hypothetical protein
VLQLNAKGVKNAAAVVGGYAAMVNAGFETETGASSR